MSTNQFLIDATTRHSVFLQRYAGGQSKKAVKTLNRLRREIYARLMQEPTQFQAGRLKAALDDINSILAQGFNEINAQIKLGALELSLDEAGFSTRLFDRAASINFATPSDGQLQAAVEANKIIGGNTITDTINDFGKKKANQITQTIADGVALGDTTPQIASRIGELMNTLHRRQLDAISRTVTNHISSMARDMVYQQNSDIISGYRWISTLDSRTTLICASRDQQIYKVGMGPMPPAHWNCRSTTIPYVKPEYDLGASITGQRPSASGLQSGNTTYGAWLKKQPTEFIDEALGPERGALFRSGKLSLDKFVDPTGRVYTLEQLRSMNPFVFQDL